MSVITPEAPVESTVVNRYADKIAKLLRKAETTTPEEAEALFAKAQELMTTYAISEAMIAKATGQSKPEEIVRKYVSYTGRYHRALYYVGDAIAAANNCRRLIQTLDRSTVLVLIGFESDVDRVVMLDASVQIQAAMAMNSWWKSVRNEDEYRLYSTEHERFLARRTFLWGYAEGLRRKLAEARDAAIAVATEEEAERSHISSAEASDSVALVLRSRKDQVNDWVDQEYGKLRSSRSSFRSTGGGYSSGVSAGRSADLGGGRIGGNRGALGR